MRKLLAILAVGAVVIACSDQATSTEVNASAVTPVASLAATHTTSNEFEVPFSRTMQAPCLGEDVFVDGVIHEVITETYSASGNYSFSYLGHPQGLRGVGVSSGLVWRFTGTTVWTINVQPDGFPYTETFVVSADVIGPRGSQYYLKELYKVTINGVGDYVVTIGDWNDWECR